MVVIKLQYRVPMSGLSTSRNNSNIFKFSIKGYITLHGFNKLRGLLLKDQTSINLADARNLTYTNPNKYTLLKFVVVILVTSYVHNQEVIACIYFVSSLFVSRLLSVRPF